MVFHALAQHATNHPYRILVVEDTQIIRQVTVALLVHAGYVVGAAEDGEFGWDDLCARNYDLVITDNAMPKMSGVELVEKMRSARMTTPVILASGTLPMQELMQNQQLDLAATLEKPFSPDQLLQTVQQVLIKARNVRAPCYWAI